MKIKTLVIKALDFTMNGTRIKLGRADSDVSVIMTSVIHDSNRHQNLFELLTNATAELMAYDWKVANQIKRLGRDGFKERYVVKLEDFSIVGDDVRDYVDILLSFGHQEEKSGIPALVDYIQEHPELLVEETNFISMLINDMYDNVRAWDPEKQGQSNCSSRAWGTEFNLRVSHAVGNYFVEGYVGGLKVRLFKTASGVQLYCVPMDSGEGFGDRCDYTFPSSKKDLLLAWFKEVCKESKR